MMRESQGSCADCAFTSGLLSLAGLDGVSFMGCPGDALISAFRLRPRQHNREHGNVLAILARPLYTVAAANPEDARLGWLQP